MSKLWYFIFHKITSSWSQIKIPIHHKCIGINWSRFNQLYTHSKTNNITVIIFVWCKAYKTEFQLGNLVYYLTRIFKIISVYTELRKDLNYLIWCMLFNSWHLRLQTHSRRELIEHIFDIHYSNQHSNVLILNGLTLPPNLFG